MAGMMNGSHIVVRRGDSFDIVLQFLHGANQPMDLTDCQLKMTVKNKDNQQMFCKVGEIITATQGKARIKLLPKDTAIAVGQYKTDIQVTLKNGDVHTVFPQDITKTGVFTVAEEVTE